MDLIIGVTGASGTIYAVKLLEALKKTESVTTHVIFSDYAWVNLEIEPGYKREDVLSLADHSYDNRDLAACISSGSYPADGVIILPCSMKTLSGIANGYADNLITRVCDVAFTGNPELVQYLYDLVIYNVLHGLRMVIKCRHGRRYDSSHLRKLIHMF